MFRIFSTFQTETNISPGELENFKIFKIFNSNWISLPIDFKSLKNRCLSLKYPDEEEGEAGHARLTGPS